MSPTPDASHLVKSMDHVRRSADTVPDPIKSILESLDAMPVGRESELTHVVARVLARILDIDESQVTPSTSILNELAAESFELSELCAQVSNETGIVLRPDNIINLVGVCLNYRHVDADNRWLPDAVSVVRALLPGTTLAAGQYVHEIYDAWTPATVARLLLISEHSSELS